MKAEEIKDILAPLLNKRLKYEPQVLERSDGGNRKYYKVTWLALGIRTFAAVNMRGHLTIHKSPRENMVKVTYEQHLKNLEGNGFDIEADVHGAVNNRYIRWDIPNLREFINFQFEYYTQDM